MTRYVITLLSVLVSFLASAQGPTASGQVARHIQALKDRGTVFAPVDLVKPMAPDARTTALWKDACTRAEVVQLNSAAVAALLQAPPATMSVAFPTPDGPVTLELEHREPFADGFTLKTALHGEVPLPAGAHYRGRVQGDNSSVAGLSIFGDEVMAIISNARGTVVVGRLAHAGEGVHIIYRDADLRMADPFTCGTEYTGGAIHPSQLQGSAGDRSVRCVKLYWEVDYPIFTNKGSVAAATNYVTGLFNQSAILYDNDGVDVQLQEVFVWDTTSPYTGPTTGDYLDQFGTYRTSFNGNLAHLLGYSGGGGIAWLNTLCSSAPYRMAYSAVNSSFSNVPTYSWSVEVVTHEQGHNMGSPHTHACAWNGNGTAIDGCGPTAGYSEGCTGPLPTGGGTIMSYCHLVGGVGINFSNGFGPQPAALIRNSVNAATCLDQCGSSCDPPGGLFVSNLTSISATLNWANIGASAYNLRWKAQASGTWNNVPGLTATSYNIGGLTQNTAYEFQVQSNCGAVSSAFGPSSVFTAPVPCQDTLEANNSFATAAAVSLPANFNALIATAGDEDYYGFTVAAIGSVNIYLSSLPADYDMELLNAGGTQLAVSQNGGTSYEYISLANVAAGYYVLHVYGWSGANNPVDCYSLSVSTYANSCVPPQQLSVTDLAYNSATLHWGMVQTAMAYDVQWKESAASTWTLVSGVTGTSYSLAGLTGSTAYQFQVRSNCSGQGTPGGEGSYSEWSQPFAFTTLTAPCWETPTTVVQVKVLLDGAWRGAAQLMADSLRKQGILPLEEPYTAMGYALTGDTLIASGVLATTGPDAIVDWVLVELRSATTPSQVLEMHAALLQRDGDVVEVDGSSPLGFCQAAGNYYVAVRHRNHLGVMTAQPVALSNAAATVDFTSSGTTTWGSNARKSASGRMFLWSGNALSDTQVKYTGSNNDRDAVLQALGGSIPTYAMPGYHAADVTLDGVVKYTGTGNDRDPILDNIGGSVPTATVEEQLP
jgi:hypothetical protein